MTNMRYAWQALTLSYESNMCLAEYQQLPRSFPWPRPAMDPLSGNDDLYVWLPCPMHSAHCPFFAGDWTDSFENKIDCSLNFGSLDCVRTESCNFQEGRLKRLALNGDCTKECMWFKHNYATNSNLNLPCSFLSRSIHRTIFHHRWLSLISSTTSEVCVEPVATVEC